MIEFIDLREEFIDSFYEAFDSVAREKKYPARYEINTLIAEKQKISSVNYKIFPIISIEIYF
jgi:hypothetical protein